MQTRRRRIEERIDTWAFGHAFSTALRRHLRHRPLQSSQIPDLAANLRKVAQHQRMNFRAGMAVPIDMELPTGGNELRLAVLDNKTGFIGTVTGPVTLTFEKTK